MQLPAEGATKVNAEVMCERLLLPGNGYETVYCDATRENVPGDWIFCR